MGGTRGSEEVRGAELAGRLPAAALNLYVGCMVICSSNLALDGWHPLCVKRTKWALSCRVRTQLNLDGSGFARMRGLGGPLSECTVAGVSRASLMEGIKLR